MARSIRVGSSPTKISTDQFFVNVLSDTGTHRKRERIHGKDAAWCPRKNFLHAQEWNFSSVFDASSQLYMGIGSGIEDALAEGLRRKGRFLYSNLYVPHMNPKVGGMIDLVYIDADDKIVIAEVKSCGNLPTEPKPEHMAQLLTYSAVAGYDIANLVYVSRNVRSNSGDVLIRTFIADTSSDKIINVLNDIAYSGLSIERGVAPPIPATMTPRKCIYCPFTKFCWDDDEYGYVAGQFEEQERDVEAELRAAALERARVLYNERPARYIDSLRTVYRAVQDESLQGKVRDEIERFVPF